MRLLILLTCIMFSIAAPAIEYPGRIKVKDKTKPLQITVNKIDQWGNIFCRYNKKDLIIRARSYYWVMINKPNILKMADILLKNGKYSRAGMAYADADRLVGKLGWGLYCRYGQAYALHKQNKNPDAIKILKPSLKYKMKYRVGEQPQLDKCLILLSRIADSDSALKALELLRKSSDSSNALYGFSYAAKLKAKNKQYTAARNLLLQAIVLFKKSTPGRKQAIEQMIILLKKHNSDLPDPDKLPAKYAAMLKHDYPPKKPGKTTKIKSITK
jgi:tetratricopeptide (TPR) repeat protein